MKNLRTYLSKYQSKTRLVETMIYACKYSRSFYVEHRYFEQPTEHHTIDCSFMSSKNFRLLDACIHKYI